jgi:hypothetical protein
MLTPTNFNAADDSVSSSGQGHHGGGAASPAAAPRIIGGHDVPAFPPTKYSFVVSLQLQRDPQVPIWTHYCGGTLVTSR